MAASPSTCCSPACAKPPEPDLRRSASTRTGTDDLWEPAFDVATVVVAIVEVWRGATGQIPLPTSLVVVVAAIGSAVRRRFPIAVTALAGCGVVAVGALGQSILSIAVLAQICLFSLVLRRSTRWWVGGAVFVTGAVSATLIAGVTSPVHGPAALITLPWTGLVVGAALAVKSHRGYIRALEEAAEAQSAARDSAMDRRITDERLRIARDLHDSVAHSIAVVTVHAGAAQRHLHESPDRAEAAIVQVRHAGSRVLIELRDILELLRSGEEEATEAVATVGGVPDLIRGANQLGLTLDVRMQADLDHLDGSGEAAVYRVLQEALTNAHRHGQGTVLLRFDEHDGGLRVRVSNEVRLLRPAATPGFGLIGMRERVARAHGLLVTRQVDGRFELDVWLPRARPDREASA